MWIKNKTEIPLEGCLPSKLDKRDVLSSEVSPDPKRIAENYPAPFDLTILKQQGSSCVGFSCACMKQEKELREKITQIFDGLWLYQQCKKIDNYSGNGTYLRTAMKVLQKQGVKPKGGLEEDAIRYRIGGYAKVDDLSFEGLKKAIYIHGALLAGFTGSNIAWSSAHIRLPKEKEKKWGHAVALIGYNKDYIIGQNSWGENWGNKGLFYVPKNYQPFESWVILTDLPTGFLLSTDGWVAQEYLRTSNYLVGQEVYPYCRLNLRKTPNGKRITTLSKKQKCIVVGKAKKGSRYNWLPIKVV